MGLTVGCAQCHDHKYDPIRQKDFYQLLAFFNSTEEEDIEAPLPGEMGTYLRERPEYERKRSALYANYDFDELQAEWEQHILGAMNEPGKDLEWDFAATSMRAMLDGAEKILRSPPEKRTGQQKERLSYYFLYNPGPSLGRDRSKLDCLKDLRHQLSDLDARAPKLTMAMTMAEEPNPVQTYIAIKGDYREKGVAVNPDTPAVLPALGEQGKGADRLALARWLVAPGNPLTARVAVNRFWQELFGRGLVRTSDDFGSQGDKPTHPELLDWLASEFQAHGWSVKEFYRLAVTSATYRQSSDTRPELKDKDPDNALLARQTRIRLTAEQIRDAALAASGLLDTRVGGPSVRPPQPAGLDALGYGGNVKWKESEGPDRYRRGLYIFFQRTVPYPELITFDAPDSTVTCTRRRRSNTSLQALNLLNDPVFFEAAQGLALRLIEDGQGGTAERIDQAFLLTLGRKPSTAERQRIQKFYYARSAALSEKQESATAIMPLVPEGSKPADAAAWVGVSRILLNLDEFITRE
jgi:hypothetical protein